MVKNSYSFKKLRRSKIVLLISCTIVVLSISCELCMALDFPSQQLFGSWQVYKDDDRPNGPIPEETMSFWENGRFLISGDSPHKGLYRINGNHLELLVKNGDRALRVERQFEITNDELKFKNEKAGWVYYKRVSKKPMGEEPDL